MAVPDRTYFKCQFGDEFNHVPEVPIAFHCNKQSLEHPREKNSPPVLAVSVVVPPLSEMQPVFM